MLAKVKEAREDLILLAVDHGESVDGDEDLISITVNSYGVIEILLFVVRSELNIYILSNARGYHSLLVVFNLKIRCLWR